MISHKHKCIFIHIPKTGGSSVENVLWPLKSDRTIDNLWMGFVKPYYNKYQTGGLQHLTSEQIKKEVGDNIFNSYYKFSIKRNPYDKAVSQFVYMKQKRNDLRGFIGMRENTSFKKYLQLISKTLHVQWMPQTDFLVDSKREVIVDDIIRFENLNEDFQIIINQLGIQNIHLSHENKTKRKHYTHYYDDESKKIVFNMYKQDIERFNYKFGE